MDLNSDGSVSLKELEGEMEKNHIKLTSEFQNDLIGLILLKKTDSNREEFFDPNKKPMSSELELKVHKCFSKLYRILRLKKLTLYRAFVAYDSDKSG